MFNNRCQETKCVLSWARVSSSVVLLQHQGALATLRFLVYTAQRGIHIAPQKLVSRASRIFRWDERAGKNTSGHSDQLSVNLRRNVGRSNLIGSLEIKHMTSGIPIILTVYFYLASVKYCLCVCNGSRLRYCNCTYWKWEIFMLRPITCCF